MPYHLATPLKICDIFAMSLHILSVASIRYVGIPSLAGVVGFEPTQCWSQSPMPYRLATPHRAKFSGVIEGDRTLDLQSHNLAFSQLNYDHHMVLPEGFEPSTSALEGHCSIQLSYGSKWSR